MNIQPAWHWNENQQIGTDFFDSREVERYERRMGEFRDLAGEDAAILAALALPAGSRVLEIGTGTGHFALAAARAGHRVTAFDISAAMLEHAQARAENEKLAGVEFLRGGFLGFEVSPGEFDAAVSAAVLHHLPDLWKAVALANVCRALKPGGLFCLRDVVFSSREPDPRWQFDQFVNSMPEGMRGPCAGHVAREYSTLDWIMEGLLARAGFEIQHIEDAQKPLIEYLCKRR